jgi:hypothetical protein
MNPNKDAVSKDLLGHKVMHLIGMVEDMLTTEHPLISAYQEMYNYKLMFQDQNLDEPNTLLYGEPYYTLEDKFIEEINEYLFNDSILIKFIAEKGLLRDLDLFMEKFGEKRN